MSPRAGEFDLIARFLRAFKPPPPPQGPGDDCAVVSVPRGQELCVTTDAVLQDVHFKLPAFSFEDVGHKALAVNLSDLAAMGAAPRWFLCALGLPAKTSAAQVEALARGMAPLAKAHGLALIGGNITRAAQLGVTLTVAGEVPTGRALRRSGGRPGDVLYVSGTLGDAKKGTGSSSPKSSLSPFLQRQRRPQPRVRLGLLSRRYARAAIDLSDGLAQDLGHLCQASGVGAVLDAGSVPVSGALAAAEGAAAWQWAVAGGEDYELLLAVPPMRCGRFERACAAAGEQVTRVGVLTAKRAVRLVRDGADVRLPRGFDHFR